MSFFYSRKAFFCLPVRIGIILCMIVGFLGGSFGAAGGWSTVLTVFARHDVNIQYRIAVLTQSVMYTYLATISMFGIVCISLRTRLRLLRFYMGALIGAILLNICTSAFFLFTLFRNLGEKEQCLEGTLESDTGFVAGVLCKDGSERTFIRLCVLLFVLVVLVFSAYGGILLSSYVAEEDIDSAARLPTTFESFSNRVRRTSSFHSADDKLGAKKGFVPLP